MAGGSRTEEAAAARQGGCGGDCREYCAQAKAMPLLPVFTVRTILGAAFFGAGAASCGLSLVRGSTRSRLLVWFGLFTGMYGLRLFTEAVPGQGAHRLAEAGLTFFMAAPALLFWRELSLGTLRKVMGGTVGIILAIGAAGFGAVLLGLDARMLMTCNQAIVIAATLLLVAFTVAPGLARAFLVTRSPVAVGGTLVLAAAVLHSNLKGILGLEHIPFLEPLAFAAFVASMGYVAAERVFADGIRLVSLEKELEVARRIQASILPEAPPASDRLRIAAVCLPMTQVGGDFYDFVPEEGAGMGILVADVSGHGVPAALIASMIKVALRSVAALARDPGGLLAGLNRVLTQVLRGKYVTASFLWLDTFALRAR